MQYDLFHVYTVDQHTLFVVRNLRRFYVPRFADEFPHCTEVALRIPKPELLYIAALYHDIAKGRGGDHSELGSEDAEHFCQRHGLSAFDTRLISWLVKYHLMMSLTAQKKDIHDPDVINEFAHFVGDQLHLDYLYLLTVADIRATNPTLWNSWRGALLKELYDGTRRALRRGLDDLIDKDERIGQIQTAALNELLKRNIDQKRIEVVWQGFNDDYFLRYSVDEIVWHTRAILKKADDDRALVLIQRNPARGGTEVFLYTRDIGGIFATTTATLDRLGLNILDARIITSNNGYTLDSFTVLEDSGKAIDDRAVVKKSLMHYVTSSINPINAAWRVIDTYREYLNTFLHRPLLIFFKMMPVAGPCWKLSPLIGPAYCAVSGKRLWIVESNYIMPKLPLLVHVQKISSLSPIKKVACFRISKNKTICVKL